MALDWSNFLRLVTALIAIELGLEVLLLLRLLKVLLLLLATELLLLSLGLTRHNIILIRLLLLLVRVNHLHWIELLLGFRLIVPDYFWLTSPMLYVL